MKKTALIAMLFLPAVAGAHVFDADDCAGFATVAYTISRMFHDDGSEANHQRIMRMVDRSIEKNMGDPTSFIADRSDGEKLRAVADMAYEHRDMDPENFANAILGVCMKHSKDKTT